MQEGDKYFKLKPKSNCNLRTTEGKVINYKNEIANESSALIRSSAVGTTYEVRKSGQMEIQLLGTNPIKVAMETALVSITLSII